MDQTCDSLPSLAESVDEPSASDEIYAPPLRISLNGQNGILGEVLIRGRAPVGCGSSARQMVDQCVEQLASALENILSRVRWDRKENINSAVRRLAHAWSLGSPLNQIFQDFAKELKDMVEFHRLSVYLVSQESDRVTCLFRTGNVVGHSFGESANPV